MQAWEKALDVTTLVAEVAERVAENLARHGLDVVVGGARSMRDYLAALEPKEAYRRAWARRTPRLVDERCDGEAEAQKARGAANGSGRDRFGDYTGAAAKARANRNSPICEDDDVWAAAAAITNRDMEGQ